MHRYDRIGAVRAGILQRQEKREDTALTMHTGDLDFTPQQHRQFAANGQTQASPSVFTRGTRIRLLKRFKDQALFFRRNPNTGILHSKGNDLRRDTEHGMIETPTLRGKTHPNLNMTMTGKFDRI